MSCWPEEVKGTKGLSYQCIFQVLIPSWAGLCYAQFKITQTLGLWALAKHGASVAILGIFAFNRKEFAIKNTFVILNPISFFQFHLF